VTFGPVAIRRSSHDLENPEPFEINGLPEPLHTRKALCCHHVAHRVGPSSSAWSACPDTASPATFSSCGASPLLLRRALPMVLQATTNDAWREPRVLQQPEADEAMKRHQRGIQQPTSLQDRSPSLWGSFAVHGARLLPVSNRSQWARS